MVHLLHSDATELWKPYISNLPDSSSRKNLKTLLGIETRKKIIEYKKPSDVGKTLKPY